MATKTIATATIWSICAVVVALLIGFAVNAYLFAPDPIVEDKIVNIEVPATYLVVDGANYTSDDIKELLANSDKIDYFATEYNEQEREKSAYTIVTDWAEDNFEDELEYQLMQFFGLADKDDLKDYDFELTYESSKFSNFDWDDEDVNVAIDGTLTYENDEQMIQGEMPIFISGTYEEDNELDNEFIQMGFQ